MRYPFTPEILWRLVGIQAYINYKRTLSRYRKVLEAESLRLQHL